MTAESVESGTARGDIRRAWLGEDETALTPARQAKHRLTAEIKRLIEASFLLDCGDSGYDNPADPDLAARLQTLTTQAATLADHLSTLPTIPRAPSPDGLPNASEARRLDALLCERSTINGRSNALAPPVTMWADGDLIRASAYFTAPYEGPPGRVHGAWVAACFDEILGCAQGASGAFGFTGTLTVTMRRATPLYTTVEYEAGFSHREGRKLFGWGKCFAEGKLTAEATGVFVIPAWAS